MNSFELCRNILFFHLAKGRKKTNVFVSWFLWLYFFRRLCKTFQSGILNNNENQKNGNQNMENLKISFLAYWLFSEFLILEDYILTIWGEVIFLCLMKTKIVYFIYFQKIKRIWWKANISAWWIFPTIPK